MALASVSRAAHWHYRWSRSAYVRCRESDCGDDTWLDRWLCTQRVKVRNEPRYEPCGAAYYYRRKQRLQAAGPPNRLLDRRYASAYSCTRGKHARPAGGVVLRHDSAPDPEQPLQDPFLLEQIERLKIVAKEARRKRVRKKAGPA